DQLKSRRVDVLWLGTNPCMPRSLELILDPHARLGDFPDFERQRKSGLFSARTWAGDVPSEGCNPTERPRGGWRVYRYLLGNVFGALDGIAMANFIPWGSQDTKTLLVELGAA